MKVQELLPGSKPSSGSRAARAAGAESKPFDFAVALTEARRKPAHRVAEQDVRVDRKPAAAKQNEAKDQPARPDDPAAAVEQPEESSATNEPQPSDEMAEDESFSEEDESSETEDTEERTDSENVERDPDLSALSPAPVTGPQPIAPPEDSGGQDDNGSREPARVVIDRTDGTESAASTGKNVAPADAEMTGIPLDLDAVDHSAGGDETPPGLEDGLTNANARGAKASANPSATVPPAPGESDAGTQSESGAKDQSKPQPAPLANEFMAAAGVSEESAGSAPAAPGSGDATTFSASSAMHVPTDSAKAPTAPPAPVAPAPLPPQTQFTEANHPKIVTAVQTQALTNGGSMQIRLDPPELGALQVLVHMQDGVMTASFQTSNDDATRLLSHSLSHLKQVLESQGLSVEKLQVQQAPKDQQPGGKGEDAQHHRDSQDDAHRQEQQRKEMLRRMWRRLSNGSDPLDLVA